MNQVIKANLVWFVTFFAGLFLAYDAPHYILFVIGAFIVSIGSLFAGHIASK